MLISVKTIDKFMSTRKIIFFFRAISQSFLFLSISPNNAYTQNFRTNKRGAPPGFNYEAQNYYDNERFVSESERIFEDRTYGEFGNENPRDFMYESNIGAFGKQRT